MKKGIYKIFLAGLLLLVILTFPFVALGGDKPKTLSNALEDTNAFANRGGYNQPLAPEIYIGRIVSIVLSFLGAIFMVLMVVGGFQWLTSGGNEEKVTKAKGLIKHSVIGLLIVFMAFMISYFIVTVVLRASVGQ
jgi:hypothetical protein